MASLSQVLNWFGFGDKGHAGHGHLHDEAGGHGHTHGVVDASLATTERGVWALKWSFVILAATSAFQLVIVFLSGSVALLADTIHNIGDAATAIPLWIAFVLARRKPSKTFTYGLGRAEDFAGIVIVLIILFSAIVAANEAIGRLINPQPVTALGWVFLAGIIGFLGNEAVAVFRIRVGRQINSAALIADGYHARTDGLTSLAVVLGAVGVWLGFPLADPIVGLLITIAIFGIVWQSARSVLTRAMDGIEPGVADEIRHAAEHVTGIAKVVDVKARWLGHQLHADVQVEIDDKVPVREANRIVDALRQEMRAHLPSLRRVSVTLGPADYDAAQDDDHGAHGHHHAPNPFRFTSVDAEGVLEIIDTDAGERMRLTLVRAVEGIEATVIIQRDGGDLETLPLSPMPGDARTFQSSVAPAEPHEFAAELLLTTGDRPKRLPFQMIEPAGHHH
jgi:cation diffusion facilitator family transporter